MGGHFVLSDVDFTSARIQRSHDSALDTASQGASFQKRNRRDRLAQYLGQSFTRRQPDPQAGKRSRARRHGKPSKVALGVPVARQQLGDLGNQLCGKCAAGQGRNLDHVEIAAIAGRFRGFDQRDAALLAGSIDGEKKHKEKFLSLKICENPWPISRLTYPSTNSSKTPPVLEGCTKTYLCPPAPVLISSETRRTPSFFSRATAAGKSGIRRHTWCRPSPRLAMNFAIAELSDVASNNSNRLSPTGTITSRTCSCSTVSSGETLMPSFS